MFLGCGVSILFIDLLWGLPGGFITSGVGRAFTNLQWGLPSGYITCGVGRVLIKLQWKLPNSLSEVVWAGYSSICSKDHGI